MSQFSHGTTVGIGFDGAETNCGIARILGILLMNSYGNQISIEAAHQIVVCPLRIIMPSCIARGRVHTTTTTAAAELPKIMSGGHAPNNGLTGTRSLGLPCTSLLFDIHVMTN